MCFTLDIFEESKLSFTYYLSNWIFCDNESRFNSGPFWFICSGYHNSSFEGVEISRFVLLIYKIYSISKIIGFLISSNIIKGSHVRYWINETIIKECWLFPFFDSPPFPREIKLITILTAFRCAWLNIEPSAKQTWQIKCATFYNVID